MMPILTITIHHSIEDLARAIRQEEEMKGVQILKMSLLTVNMTYRKF